MILCKIGLHRWERTIGQLGQYHSVRLCKRCKRMQWRIEGRWVTQVFKPVVTPFSRSKLVRLPGSGLWMFKLKEGVEQQPKPHFSPYDTPTCPGPHNPTDPPLMVKPYGGRY